jgi:hypothetical protein
MYGKSFLKDSVLPFYNNSYVNIGVEAVPVTVGAGSRISGQFRLYKRFAVPNGSDTAFELGMQRILFLPDIWLIKKPDTGYPAGYLS